MIPGNTRTASMLREFALSHDGVDEGVACAGTAIESQTFNVKKKTFLFLEAKDDLLIVRFRLKESVPELEKLAKADPAAFETGKFGWSKLTFEDRKPPAKKDLKRWIAESYQQFAPKKKPAK